MANENQPSMHDVQAQLRVEQDLQNPKDSNGVFDLPCGFLDRNGTLHTEVALREITGHEEDMLTSKKTSGVKKMNELFSRCITRLGSITEKGPIAVAVPDLLVGDRVFLMFALRRVTLGDDYPFKDKCPSCGKESLFQVDLGQIKIRKMPNPAQRLYDAKTSTGVTYRFHPLSGRDESQIIDLGALGDSLSLSIMVRLEQLNGTIPTMEAVKALSSRERNEMRSEFDLHDGGVDTEADFSCEKCGEQFKRDIDASQASFFFPSAARRS